MVAQELSPVRVMGAGHPGHERVRTSRYPDPAAAVIVPVAAADLPAVSEFLAAHHNRRVPWLSAATAPWNVDAPNHGFMLMAGSRVVGTVLALYSERDIAGRRERFCNMGSWCVLPEYRSRSMALLRTLLDQDGYHFTTLSPDDGPQEILAWLRFRFLDTSAALIPNLPWPTVIGRTRVLTNPADIDAALAGAERRIYRDHRRALATRHVVLRSSGRACHVVYRVVRHRRVPVFAMVLHVSDPDILRRTWRSLTRHLLVRHGLVATLVEHRVAPALRTPSFCLQNWPKMYRSDRLAADHVDYLYSELTCVPW